MHLDLDGIRLCIKPQGELTTLNEARWLRDVPRSRSSFGIFQCPFAWCRHQLQELGQSLQKGRKISASFVQDDRIPRVQRSFETRGDLLAGVQPPCILSTVEVAEG